MAIKDYSNKRYMAIEEQKQEITTFFTSPDFHMILSLLSLDEDEFFNSLKKYPQTETKKKGGEIEL
jgi:hypothetical protein